MWHVSFYVLMCELPPIGIRVSPFAYCTAPMLIRKSYVQFLCLCTYDLSRIYCGRTKGLGSSPVRRCDVVKDL